MPEPDQKRSRILLAMRWLVAFVCGLISAIAAVTFVAANSVLLFTSAKVKVRLGEPEVRVESYRYEVLGTVVAEGDDRNGADVPAAYFRCQCLHVGGSLLLAFAIGLLVGGLVFSLWRPVFESPRRELE